MVHQLHASATLHPAPTGQKRFVVLYIDSSATRVGAQTLTALCGVFKNSSQLCSDGFTRLVQLKSNNTFEVKPF